MNLAEQYRNQFRWRRWSRVLDALPRLEGQTVLDLGCAVGDLSAELVARGARVIGVELDEALLAVARSRNLPNAVFHAADLRALPLPRECASGLWCSFVAAYFPQLDEVLRHWREALVPGGWAMLTEIDHLLGHEPVDETTRELLQGHAERARSAGRYDFHMGGKLRRHLEASGFTVVSEFALDDDELSFDGPASPEVLEAWRARLDRMVSLREHCGPRFEHVRAQLLAALQSAEHRSVARVCGCLAVKA